MEETNPLKLDKYFYIKNTPTWWVMVMCSFGLFAITLVLLSFWAAIVHDPVYRYFFGPMVAVVILYEFVWCGTNFFYRQVDLKKHLTFIERHWKKGTEPSVDIFLPICGESIAVLNNTWKYVSQITYQNKKVYVLDDSKENNEAHQSLAEQYGFNYLSRPNKGEMKKAGNLKYGFNRTEGEYIAIFDADFAPHPDFLKELIPYMSNPNIGILQTPQFFYTPADAKVVNRRSRLEYGAAYNQEDFYRIGQAARDYFGASICCGTNAIYRRNAIQSIGGPLQVDKSEDARTGYALLEKGWQIHYLPVILAIGLCPDNIYTYFHQQHRWANGRMELTFSKAFWKAKVSPIKKLFYLSGSLFYVQHLLVLLVSFHVFYILIFYNHSLRFADSLPFIPYLLFQFFYLPFIFRLLPLRLGAFFVGMSQLYSHGHAVLTAIAGKSVGWISTNAKHTSVSPAFRQTTEAVGLYVFFYVILIGLSVRGELLKPLNNNYLLQFWVFWNFILSGLLLLQMYLAIQRTRASWTSSGQLSRFALYWWTFRTAGLYLISTSFVFWFFAYW